MSVLEIVLVVLISVGMGLYLAFSIYDMIHPEKKKARKEAKRQKKEQRKLEKQKKYENDTYEE